MPEESSSTKEQLIGVIDAGTRTVKFCVFRSQHTKEIAEYAVDITPHTPQEGWFEEDPLEILEAVRKCIKNALSSISKFWCATEIDSESVMS